jgi:hypothetical protein
MPSNDASGTIVPKDEQMNDDYRKVFGLYRYYHRAAVTLTVLGLVRAGLPALAPDVVAGGWVDRFHLGLCVIGCGYVAAPYTRRFLEMITLVQERR